MIRSALQACLGELRSAQRRDHRSIRSSSSSSSSSSGDAATAAVAAATKELLLNAAAQPSQYLLAEALQDGLTVLHEARDFAGAAEVSAVFSVSTRAEQVHVYLLQLCEACQLLVELLHVSLQPCLIMPIVVN
jgi:hypothetical protein